MKFVHIRMKTNELNDGMKRTLALFLLVANWGNASKEPAKEKNCYFIAGINYQQTDWNTIC